MWRNILRGLVLVGFTSIVLAHTEPNKTQEPPANPIIATMFEHAREVISATDVPDTMEAKLISELVEKLPAIPEENITDFPEPIAADEQDSEILLAFYNRVAESYLKAAETEHEASAIAYERMKALERKGKLRTFRAEDVRPKKGEFITEYGEKEEFSGGTTLPMSAKHIPSPLMQKNLSIQRERYKSQKLAAEELILKGNFYAAMAEQLKA